MVSTIMHFWISKIFSLFEKELDSQLTFYILGDHINNFGGLANQGSGQGSFGVEKTQNGKVQMAVRGVTTAQATSTTTLVSSKYYCVVGTYATTPSTKIYLNGEFEAQSTTNPTLTVLQYLQRLQ